MRTAPTFAELFDMVDNGDLDGLKNIYGDGYAINDTITMDRLFHRAIEKKQFNILMWVMESGYKEWSDDTYDDITLIAVDCGRIDILRWALNMGWDMDSMTFITAAYAKNTEILQLMYDNGYTPSRFYATYESLHTMNIPEVSLWLNSIEYIGYTICNA